jgi:acyl-CoA synthetase (AMP-forming)/AMP-acid ligase II
MLYERWIEIAGERRGELALRDAASGRRWTFDQLRAAGESHGLDGDVLVHPRGNTPEFLMALLASWREGKVACPLEPAQPPPNLQPPPRGCVHLKLTSATTGTPRLVAFTEQQLAADAHNIVLTMGLRADWPNLGVISMAHSYGFSNLVLPLLLHGIPLILASAALPDAVRCAAKGESALTMAAVPAMWSAWLQAGAIPSAVRLAISAGAPLAASLEGAMFQRTGLKLHNFYGSTECGGIAYDATDTPRTQDGCVGTPMRNVDLSISSDGLLVVRGRAVGETYWPEPAESLGNGSFQTSDLAEIKQDNVHLLGRLGDQLNIAGRKVSASAIEEVLSRHPSVTACLVFGVPGGDSARADLIVACVVAAKPLTADTLKQFLLERLPAWQVPRRWWFVESLSANDRGKISRAEWRDRFLESDAGHG